MRWSSSGISYDLQGSTVKKWNRVLRGASSNILLRDRKAAGVNHSSVVPEFGFLVHVYVHMYMYTNIYIYIYIYIYMRAGFSRSLDWTGPCPRLLNLGAAHRSSACLFSQLRALLIDMTGSLLRKICHRQGL